MMSPIRTRSLVTVTAARSAGAAMMSARDCATAAAAWAASSAMAMRNVRAVITKSSAEHVGGGLHHLVGRADDLGVHLVGALGGDQVGNFGDDLDIGLFEVGLLHVAKAVGV